MQKLNWNLIFVVTVSITIRKDALINYLFFTLIVVVKIVLHQKITKEVIYASINYVIVTKSIMIIACAGRIKTHRG